jgi:hypothetical protein
LAASSHHRAAFVLVAISSLACSSSAKRIDGSGGGGGASDSVAASSGPLSGAGTSSCSNLCERAQGCSGASPLDCDKECAELAATATKAGCPDVIDDLVACAEKQPDVCNMAGACPDESDAFIACIGAYCQKHTMDPGCST